MRRAVFVAFLLILGSAVLGATVLREPFAWAASPFQNVIVANDASAPVPVKAPQWQGEPYMTSRVVLGARCDNLPEIPAGKVLFVQRAIVTFNHAPGMTGSAALLFQPLGAAGPITLNAPAHESGRAQQVAGIYEAYSGVIELGQPTASTMQGCLFGGPEDDLAGRFLVMGYLLPAS